MLTFKNYEYSSLLHTCVLLFLCYLLKTRETGWHTESVSPGSQFLPPNTGMWNLYPNSGISVESENEWVSRRDQKRKGETKAKWHYQISTPSPGYVLISRNEFWTFPSQPNPSQTGVGSRSRPRASPCRSGRGTCRALPPCPRAAGAKAKGGSLPPAAAATTMGGGAPPVAPANGSAGAGGGGRGEGCEWPAGGSGANFEGDIKGRRGSFHFLPLIPPLPLLLLLPPLPFQPCSLPAPRSLPATTSPGFRPRRASLL